MKKISTLNPTALTALLLLIITATCAFSEILNPQFSAHRHYIIPRYMGLSQAGVALPEVISSSLVNPALIHSWHVKSEYTYSGTLVYAKDSVFSRYVITTGASWRFNETTTIGSIYRNLKREDNNYQNDILICVSGRLFDRSTSQGAVNLGMNMRIENMKWEYPIDSLPVYAHVHDAQIHDTTVLMGYTQSPYSNESRNETRLLFDLGFFQDNIFPGMDFGLTFHNLFTRRWKSEKPSIIHKDTTVYDTIITIVNPDSLLDTVIIDSLKHTNTWTDSKGRFPKVYKRMTVGLAYHAPIMQNKVELVLPFDVEFLGLFDKKQDVKVGLHTGIEAWLNKKICLRFGYAYAPNYILGSPGDIAFESHHILSGGVSVLFEKVRFEVYIKKQDWGVGSSVTF